MKTTKFQITVTCSDEFHESDVKRIVADIQCGKMQREWETSDKSGRMKVKAIAVVLGEKKVKEAI